MGRERERWIYTNCVPTAEERCACATLNRAQEFSIKFVIRNKWCACCFVVKKSTPHCVTCDCDCEFAWIDVMIIYLRVRYVAHVRLVHVKLLQFSYEWPAFSVVGAVHRQHTWHHHDIWYGYELIICASGRCGMPLRTGHNCRTEFVWFCVICWSWKRLLLSDSFMYHLKKMHTTVLPVSANATTIWYAVIQIMMNVIVDSEVAHLMPISMIKILLAVLIYCM